MKKGVAEAAARKAAREVADVFGKIKGEGDKYPTRIEQLVFVSAEERADALALAERIAGGETIDLTKTPLLRPVDGAVDIGMFGRMLADDPDFNREAAVQVAHAVTTHRAVVEDDYYTAIDDLKNPAEDAGAGFVGEAGFGAGTFYLYLCIDRDLLTRNLGGDADLARRGLAALIQAAATVGPRASRRASPAGRWRATASSRSPTGRRIPSPPRSSSRSAARTCWPARSRPSRRRATASGRLTRCRRARATRSPRSGVAPTVPGGLQRAQRRGQPQAPDRLRDALMPAGLAFTLYAPLAGLGDLAVGERRGGFDRPGRSAILGLVAAGPRLRPHGGGEARRPRPAATASSSGYGAQAPDDRLPHRPGAAGRAQIRLGHPPRGPGPALAPAQHPAVEPRLPRGSVGGGGAGASPRHRGPCPGKKSPRPCGGRPTPSISAASPARSAARRRPAASTP